MFFEVLFSFIFYARAINPVLTIESFGFVFSKLNNKYLRAPVCKNQTKSKFRGKGGKFDFFHLMLDRLGYN